MLPAARIAPGMSISTGTKTPTCAGRPGMLAVVPISVPANAPRADTVPNVATMSHRAQQLNLELTRWSDLILGMEKHHLDYANDLDPTTRGKTFLLGHWTRTEVPDPYREPEDAHQLAYDIISEAVDLWVGKI